METDVLAIGQLGIFSVILAPASAEFVAPALDSDIFDESLGVGFMADDGIDDFAFIHFVDETLCDSQISGHGMDVLGVPLASIPAEESVGDEISIMAGMGDMCKFGGGQILLDSGASDCLTGNRSFLSGEMTPLRLPIRSADSASGMMTDSVSGGFSTC